MFYKDKRSKIEAHKIEMHEHHFEIIHLNRCMLTLELSSYLLEIPYGAFTILSQL